MFYDGPSIDRLHFLPWKVKGQIGLHENRENVEVVFGHNSAATKTNVFQQRFLDCATLGAGSAATPRTAYFLVNFFTAGLYDDWLRAKQKPLNLF